MMIIKYVGHACFKITEGDFSIVIDPYADGSVPGLKDMHETANLVICSHGHMDHHGIENVKISEVRIDTPFEMSCIRTYHDDKEGTLRGPNEITVMKAEGRTIVHMGDIGCMLSGEDIDKLKGCDLLLIPVGGFFTIDGKQAAEYVKLIAPKAVVPMHYRGASFGYSEIGTLDGFTGRKDLPVRKIGSELDIDEIKAGSGVLVMTPANA